jgi:hypothetical protein
MFVRHPTGRMQTPTAPAVSHPTVIVGPDGVCVIGIHKINFLCRRIALDPMQDQVETLFNVHGVTTV